MVKSAINIPKAREDDVIGVMATLFLDHPMMMRPSTEDENSRQLQAALIYAFDMSQSICDPPNADHILTSKT
jgi:hypothetical protein